MVNWLFFLNVHTLLSMTISQRYGQALFPFLKQRRHLRNKFIKTEIVKKILLMIISCFLLNTSNLYSQTIAFDKGKLEAVNVSMSVEQLMGRQVVKVVKDSVVETFDQPTFVKLPGINFKNGTIEVNISRLLPNAPEFARGFIGIGFRVNESNSKFECIYIRPVNGRADNQL